MKVLIIDDVCFDKQHDTVARHEFEYLQKQGHSVYLYGWGNPQNYTNSHFVVCPESSGYFRRKVEKFWGSSRLKKHFKETLKTIDPDVIHIHLVSKFPLAIYPELGGKRVVHTLHGPNLFCPISWGCTRRNSAPCELGVGLKCWLRGCCSFNKLILLYPLWKKVNRCLQRNITLFHCPSRNIYRAAWNVGFQNLCYAPLGIENLFQFGNNIYKNKIPTVLFVGSVAEAKGIRYLLNAFLLILQEMPTAQLLIAGRGPDSNFVQSFVNDHKLQEHVKCLGFVAHDNLGDIYKKSHVLVMPSIWSEQFGRVGPEALLCGTPCVASDIGGIPEWLIDQESGFLVSPRNQKALAERILTLLKNPILAKQFGEFGGNFIRNHYSIEKFNKNMERMLMDVATGKSPHSFYDYNDGRSL